MQAEREVVVQALRSDGDHDRALQAQCVLPTYVDSDADAGLLSRLGVDLQQLAG